MGFGYEAWRLGVVFTHSGGDDIARRVKTYDVAEPRDPTLFSRCLERAEGIVGFAGFAERSWQDCSDWFKPIAAHRVSSTRTLKWPGTEVFSEDQSAIFHVFRVNGKLIEWLQSQARHLLDFGDHRPEDFCLLREDRSPWLTTITHEEDIYFELSDEEFESLVS